MKKVSSLRRRWMNNTLTTFCIVGLVFVLVISGTDGIQAHTLTLWRLLERYQVPAFLFINKMDSVLLSNPKVRDFSTGGPSQKAEIQITKQS